MLKVNATECFEMGNVSEMMVAGYFEGAGCQVWKVDHNLHPYDLDVVGKTDLTYTIEVKTWGMASNLGCDTFFAETLQISAKQRIESVPEYLTHNEEISYVVWYNRFTGYAYFFDCTELADYMRDNLHRETYNKFKTAKGILVKSESAEAGFKFKEYIGVANG